MKLENVTGVEFGTAKLVTCSNKTTTIIDGSGDEKQIQVRIEEIKSLIDASESVYETEQLQERLGKLVGGVAILRIGAESELELKEKKDRVEDALAATRAAVDEGIIPGGGIALRKASNRCLIECDNSEQDMGRDIVLEAIKAPFESILQNAGQS